MSLTIKDIQLLKNYNKIWTKIEKLMKQTFNTKTTYGDDDEYIKTRMKTYKDSITANFYNKNGSKKIPECKYVKENIKTDNYIHEELESESESDSDSGSDSDSDIEEQIRQ